MRKAITQGVFKLTRLEAVNPNRVPLPTRVGSGWIEIRLHHPAVHWGELLEATCVIGALDRELKLQRVKIKSVVEAPPHSWPYEPASGDLTELRLRPGEERKILVSVPIEPGFAVGPVGTLELTAFAKTHWLGERCKVAVPFDILPNRHATEFAWAIAEVVGMTRIEWSLGHPDRRGAPAVARLTRPRAGLPIVLGLAELVIRQVRDDVCVNIRLTPIPGLYSGLDRIGCRQYRHRVGHEEATVKHFRDSMRPYLDEARDLPVPASIVSLTQSALPVTAAAVDTDSRELPIPVDE